MDTPVSGTGMLLALSRANSPALGRVDGSAMTVLVFVICVMLGVDKIQTAPLREFAESAGRGQSNRACDMQLDA